MDFRAVDCIFRAGNKCENRNVYSDNEAQDSPALSARCNGMLVEERERSRGSSSKINGTVPRLTTRPS